MNNTVITIIVIILIVVGIIWWVSVADEPTLPEDDIFNEEIMDDDEFIQQDEFIIETLPEDEVDADVPEDVNDEIPAPIED